MFKEEHHQTSRTRLQPLVREFRRKSSSIQTPQNPLVNLGVCFHPKTRRTCKNPSGCSSLRIVEFDPHGPLSLCIPSSFGTSAAQHDSMAGLHLLMGGASLASGLSKHRRRKKTKQCTLLDVLTLKSRWNQGERGAPQPPGLLSHGTQ